MDYRQKYTEKDSACAYSIAIFSSLVVSLVYFIICGCIAAFSNDVANTFSSHVATSVMVTFFVYMTYGLFMFIYHKKTKTNVISAMQLKKKISIKDSIICVSLALVTLFGFLFIVNFLTDALKLTGYVVNNDLPFPLHNFGWFLANVVVLAVLPAVFEELIYRGMLLNGLRKFGDGFAIVVSSLLFSLAHGSPVQTIYQFVLGMVFAFIVVKTGSVILSMITHFLNNFTVVLISYIEAVNGIQATETTVFDYSAGQIIFAFGAAIVAVGLIYLLIKALSKPKEEQIYKKEEGAKFEPLAKSILFITIACAAVIWISDFVSNLTGLGV